jgi:TDG/mug DNA glycosylase family protein
MTPQREPPVKPTPEQIAAAQGRTVPDVIAPNLRILFCGINPGLYSGAVGHHFARPGNRFWKALHRSGLTPRRLKPWEERRLLDYGCGITNLVERATGSADELSNDELIRGRRSLAGKVGYYRPAAVAVLGIGAFRTAFGRPHARVGRQEDGIGASRLWALPNPSGLNAHYQIDDFVNLFATLKKAVSR